MNGTVYRAAPALNQPSDQRKGCGPPVPRITREYGRAVMHTGLRTARALTAPSRLKSKDGIRLTIEADRIAEECAHHRWQQPATALIYWRPLPQHEEAQCSTS
jgi:hypothetical protein